MKCQVIRDTRNKTKQSLRAVREADGPPLQAQRNHYFMVLCNTLFSHQFVFLFFSSMLVFSVHPNVSQGCQGGCATCSDYNGCLSCKPRLFFVLERIGMKQIGVCLSSCPSGYYGTRYPDINKCASKCRGKGKRVALFVLSRTLCPLRSQVNRGQAVSLFIQFIYSSTANINLSKKLKITNQLKAQGSWHCTKDLPGTPAMVSSSTPPPKPEEPVGARHCSLAARGSSSSSKEQSRGRGMQEPFKPLPP